MTLHWWQHWFWITGRAPVVALLLAACHVCCQQPPWGPAPGHPGLVGAGDAALPHWWLPVQAAEAPVALHVPVDGPPPGWYPWAPRRLLGFAAAADGTASPVAVSTEASAAASAAAPVAVTYLTTLGPGLGGVTSISSQTSAAASSAAPRAREPKAIGVLPVGVMPTVVRAVPTAATPPPSRPPGTVTSVLEIVEELAEATTASPSESAPTSTASASASESPNSPTAAENEAGLQASSAEMPNDEPAKAASASSAEASPTEASEAVPSPTSSAGSASTAPTRMQSMSLSTAAAGDAAVPSAATTAATKPDLSPPARGSTDVVAHPAVSVPRRVATTPVSATAAPTTPTWTTGSPTTATATAAVPHSHRAAGPLGASSSSSGSGSSRQHAMSLSSGGGLDAGSITGIVLGIVVFAGLVGTVSFILYRRRYLNKPQTLNDKCSNPDSSGYIDDSTFRENSEEMYSLDNDSFLNSLEAMTIQNYWTDTVKHTKL